MSGSLGSSSGDEGNVSRGFKQLVRDLGPMVPPAPPLARIEGARVAEMRTRHRGQTPQQGARLRFLGGAGASLGLVGIATVLVLVLGSGLVPGATAPSEGDESPTTGASTVPTASSGPTDTPASSPTAIVPLARTPEQVFSTLGSNASWSPSGTRIAYGTAGRTAIVDTAGRTIETVAAEFIVWIDDSTFLGFNPDRQGGATRAFVGRVGSTAAEAVPGGFYPGPIVAAAGVVILPVDVGSSHYVVWTSAGLSATRAGTPISLSSDGRLLAVSVPSQTGSDRLDVVATDTGKVEASDARPADTWRGAWFSPDGRKLALSQGFGLGRLGILDLASGHLSVADSCFTQYGAWIDDSHLLIASADPCHLPDGSGVTVTTTGAGFLVAATHDRVAVLSAEASPSGTGETIRVTIESGSGPQESVDLNGSYTGVRLSWSPDGSLLLIEYAGPGNSNPPRHVLLVRPSSV